MDRNLHCFLTENHSDLIFDNLNSECEEATTPTDVFNISDFVTEGMDSLTKYLESETIVKEFVEESMAKSDRMMLASPPAKKCKFDPLALLALHRGVHPSKLVSHAPKVPKQKVDPLALLALHRGVHPSKLVDHVQKPKKKVDPLALLALHRGVPYTNKVDHEQIDLDEESNDEDDDDDEVDDDERDWDNSKWDEDCEAENKNEDIFGFKVDSKNDKDESWKKSIREGDDYQAVVPDDIYPYDDPSLDHNEDKKLWEPHQLSEDDVKEYLTQYVEAVGAGAETVTEERWKQISAAYPKECENNTKEDMFREDRTVDNEQALYLLLQCGYNTEEALRRAKLLRRLLLKQKYLAKKNCTKDLIKYDDDMV